MTNRLYSFRVNKEGRNSMSEIRPTAAWVLQKEVLHLRAENEKLKAENENLKAENGKLRELVTDMWHELDAVTQYDAGGSRGVVFEFKYTMRDLGIEVINV